MKKFLWLIVIILVALGLYKIFRDQSIEPSESKSITVALANVNNSGMDGQAVLTEVDGQIRITIKLVGAPIEKLQQAYFQKGSCAALGEPIYTLKPVASGVSETTLTVALAAITDSLPLAIGVYPAETETSVGTNRALVACGEIIFHD